MIVFFILELRMLFSFTIIFVISMLNPSTLFAEKKCPDQMMFVPKGIFWAGEANTLQKMTTDSFCIDQTEVTQTKYEVIMGENPSYFYQAENPVETVSWFEAQKYCENLNKRLPTEKEWEKAARAGTKYKYFWGNQIDPSYLWFSYNSSYKTHSVAQKKSNGFGLSDILGNVYEWTSNWYSNQEKFKVLRGGSWANRKNSVRIAYRDRASPSQKGSDIGFRCAK
jgi:formylglycine-generating enzyme